MTKSSSADRRRFLTHSALGAAGAAVGIAPLAARDAEAQSAGRISAREIAILKFLAAAELVEADLWLQYEELSRRNPAYRAALEDIDEGLSDYAIDTQEDEESHAAFINAFLLSIGEQPVNLDPFRTILPPPVTGLRRVGRLTNLTRLTVDTSYYTRYRGVGNPDFGASFAQIATIRSQPAIPLSNATPPRQLAGIVQVAAFHFASIEQGGTSLYSQFLPFVRHPDVVRILAGIGPTEAIHFAHFRQSLEGVRGFNSGDGQLVVPNLTGGRRDATRVMPRPCIFLRSDLPRCSVVRPTAPDHAGARAAASGLVASGLFAGQSPAFLNAVAALAAAADGVA